MQETISIEEVEGMLDAAHFHLRRLDDEYEKMSGRDPRALRAYIFASLVLGGSIFYTLTNPKSNVLNPFKKATTAWLSDLESKPDEYKFFNRMLHHRDYGVHVSTDPTEAAVSSIPAHLDPSIHVFSVPSALMPDTLMANPDSEDSPRYASAWVSVPKFRIDGEDARTSLQRFLGLLTNLVQHCKTGSEKGGQAE